MIEAKFTEQKPLLQSYPKLMRSKTLGIVVLFYFQTDGMVVADSNDVGYHSGDWNMSDFEDYHGVVTLQNKPA